MGGKEQSRGHHQAVQQDQSQDGQQREALGKGHVADVHRTQRQQRHKRQSCPQPQLPSEPVHVGQVLSDALLKYHQICAAGIRQPSPP